MSARTNKRHEGVIQSSRAGRWALFFSLLALIISCVCLLAIYKEGRILKNAALFMTELRQTVHDVRQQDAVSSTRNGSEWVDWKHIDQKLGELQQMVAEGDRRLEPHLDAFVEDLSTIRDYATTNSREVLDQTTERLRELRRTVHDQAPGVASLLRDKLIRLRQVVASHIQSRQANERQPPEDGS